MNGSVAGRTARTAIVIAATMGLVAWAPIIEPVSAYDVATAVWGKITISTTGGTGESVDGVAASASTWYIVGCRTNVSPNEIRVHKTTNAGVTWSSMVPWTHASFTCNAGTSENAGNKWRIDAEGDHVAVLAKASNGTFAVESLDAGATWRVRRLSNLNVGCTAIDVGPGTDYIGGSTGSTPTYRLWKNTGSGWTSINTTVFTSSFGGAACDVASDDELIVWFHGVNNDGSRYRNYIFKSENGGGTFSAVRQPSGGDCGGPFRAPFAVVDRNTVYQFIPKFHDSSGNCGSAPPSCGNTYCGQVIKTTNAGGSFLQLQYGGPLVGCAGDETRLKHIATTSLLLGCNANAVWLTEDDFATITKATSTTMAACATMNEWGNVDYVFKKLVAFYGEGSDANEQARVCVTDTPALGSGAGAVGAYIFCSAIGNTRGGYDFLEDVKVQRGEQFIPFGLTIDRDRFLFQGSIGDLSYLGKTWGHRVPQGTKAVRVNFTIEEVPDLMNSGFRAVFSTVAPGGTSTSPSLDKGDGYTTGAFAEHVEADFFEVDDDWNVKLYQRTQAGDRFQVGTAWLGGNPNVRQSYSLEVDSRPNAMYFGVRGADGTFLKVGSTEFKGTLSSNFQDVGWKQQWFVGYGVDAVTIKTETVLESGTPSGGRNSTCLFDIAGTVAGACTGGVCVDGDPGRLIDPQQGVVPDEDDQDDEEGGDEEGGGAKDDAVRRMFPGSGTKNGSLIYSFITIILFAVGAWRLTGGQVERGVWRPGNPAAIGLSAYFGLCVASIVFNDDLFWIAAAIAALAIAGAVAKAVSQHSRE